MNTTSTQAARRGSIVRMIAALTGDAATACAVGSACSWIIASATLGTFAAFLTWLAGVVLALAVSQYVVHPLVSYALSDKKLDTAAHALRSAASSMSQELHGARFLWAVARAGMQRAASRPS